MQVFTMMLVLAPLNRTTLQVKSEVLKSRTGCCQSANQYLLSPDSTTRSRRIFTCTKKPLTDDHFFLKKIQNIVTVICIEQAVGVRVVLPGFELRGDWEGFYPPYLDPPKRAQNNRLGGSIHIVLTCNPPDCHCIIHTLHTTHTFTAQAHGE